ncbi:MAG: response regulator transcription factor [Treponema sp.]|nr:response regulator transcription factor [Treponema sp.]
MIRTVIIDSQKEDRDRITSILSAQVDFKVLSQGKDAYDALKLIGSHKPDIAILGNELEFINGEEIPPLLRARSPSTAVVILTSKASDLQLCRAVINEASGLLHKETDMHLLPWILKCIHEGGCFISPSLASRVLHLLVLTQAKASLKTEKEKFLSRDDPTGYLSKTELQILTCVGEGNSSEEIAQILDLTVGTVRNYISAVMHKTGQHNRSQLVLYAFRYGLVPNKL